MRAGVRVSGRRPDPTATSAVPTRASRPRAQPSLRLQARGVQGVNDVSSNAHRASEMSTEVVRVRASSRLTADLTSNEMSKNEGPLTRHPVWHDAVTR